MSCFLFLKHGTSLLSVQVGNLKHRWIDRIGMDKGDLEEKAEGKEEEYEDEQEEEEEEDRKSVV